MSIISPDELLDIEKAYVRNDNDRFAALMHRVWPQLCNELVELQTLTDTAIVAANELSGQARVDAANLSDGPALERVRIRLATLARLNDCLRDLRRVVR